MAATAISLRHVRSYRQRFLHNPNTSFHLFSTSSSPENPDPDSDHTPSSNPQQQQQQQQQQSSFASYFSDIKASLKQSPTPPPPSPSPRQTYSPPQRPAQSVDSFASIQEIRKNLSEFRLRSNPPPSPPHPPRPSSTGPTLSLQELYERNVSQRGGGGAAKIGKPITDMIRESLRNMGNNAAVQQQPIKKIQMPERFKESLNNLQASNLNKDKQTKEVSEDNKREFLRRSYGFDELGQILRQLRPEVKGKKNWFSLEELNGRLKRLSEIEENQTVLNFPGLPIGHLRDSLAALSEKEAEAGKARENRFLAHSLLGQSSLTPSFMLSPPKDELVEKYFHPDHMSSAEKLKLELKKVRDEFKMSESDCGSARVQVAQLTTKIKHLSTVLHKKDKHSRKGLQEMVQQRKKLLKYLRRTDWDSYCLVLSKLGLRDNPDYKHA